MKNYSSTRLLFRRSVIEGLAEGEKFQIVTPQGTFELTRQEFEFEFPNVVESRSYRLKGIYHYPRTPQRALRFLISSATEQRRESAPRGKYELPSYLSGVIAPALYADWLHKKAVAHAVRDRRRWKKTITVSSYKLAIHQAVARGNGLDPYSGESLHWHLIGKYDNREAKGKGSRYKRQFRLLPTLDHLEQDYSDTPQFQICSWEVNDAKSELSHEEFITLCGRIWEAAQGRPFSTQGRGKKGIAAEFRHRGR